MTPTTHVSEPWDHHWHLFWRHDAEIGARGFWVHEPRVGWLRGAAELLARIRL